MSLPRTESEGLTRTGRDWADPHLGSPVLFPYYLEESRDWVVAKFSEAISFLLGAGAVAQTCGKMVSHIFRNFAK